jgi:hypothetical protein
MYHNKLLLVLLVSVALSLCHGAAIYPKTLRTQKGSASSVAISALQKQDQSGSQDSWSKYVEFYGSDSVYTGVFTFDASSVVASQVATYSLDVNFKGPKHSSQVWEFEFYEPASNTWIFAGDNTDAASWSWTALSFCGTVSFADLIQDGNIQVRYSCTAASDDSDLDYLAIITSADAATGSTSAPTTKPTTAPTTKPSTTGTPSTPKPTTAPATPKPTSTPTTKPTTAPTTKPSSTSGTSTTKPTTKPTSAPTTKPTSAPTTAPTTKPSTGSSSGSSTQAPGGRMCPAGQVWSPRPLTTWQWQLTGTIDQSVDVQMYDIDLFDNTADTIASLHAAGRAVICYFSTQYENWRPDAADFTAAVLGSNLDDWPGERYVDIRSTVVRTIMQNRLDLAVSKGCDGVEPDNVDEYENTNGLGITAADQLDFNQFIASEAHKRGLSVGLKNDLDQVEALQPYFDWVLDEQCNQYSECSDLTPFATANKAVFGTEYSGSASSFCPKMITDKFSWLLKDLNLDATVTQCCTYNTGGCATKAAYSCVSYASKRSVDGTEVMEVVAEYEPVQQQQEPSAVEYDSAASTMFPAAAIAVVAVAALLL